MIIKPITEIIKEIQEAIDKNDYETAYQTIKESVDLNKEHIEGEYVFKNLLEELLFQILIKKEVTKKIPLILDYSTLYSNCGDVFLYRNDMDNAKKNFHLSYEYNPINIKANFGLGEIAKREGNIEEFYKLTMESFKIAYHPEDLSKSFINLSYYFLKIADENQDNEDKIKENLKIAIFLKNISKAYGDESELAKEELSKIDSIISDLNKKLSEAIKINSINECKQFLKAKGLPYEAGIEVITICKNLGFQLDEAKKVVPALYYFNIAYDLTKDENIKSVIDDLNEKVERRLNE